MHLSLLGKVECCLAGSAATAVFFTSDLPLPVVGHGAQPSAFYPGIERALEQTNGLTHSEFSLITELVGFYKHRRSTSWTAALSATSGNECGDQRMAVSVIGNEWTHLPASRTTSPMVFCPSW